MLEKKQKLETAVRSIQSQLRPLPDGEIFCSKNGKYYKWYQTNAGLQTYIPKKNRDLAEKLALKKYLCALIKEYSQELTATKNYLKHYPSRPKLSELMLTEMPAYQELLTPYFKPESHDLFEWAKSPYERSTKYPEQLTQKTSSGNIVRSKSEALIDILLYVNKIPFRYECALRLDNSILYPDFTIRHPSNGHFYYWEHFGLMDDPNYSKNVWSKLQLYTSHNIIPGIHLITTYETKACPLNTDTIEKIISTYFN